MALAVNLVSEPLGYAAVVFGDIAMFYKLPVRPGAGITQVLPAHVSAFIHDFDSSVYGVEDRPLLCKPFSFELEDLPKCESA